MASHPSSNNMNMSSIKFHHVTPKISKYTVCREEDNKYTCNMHIHHIHIYVYITHISIYIYVLIITLMPGCLFVKATPIQNPGKAPSFQSQRCWRSHGEKIYSKALRTVGKGSTSIDFQHHWQSLSYVLSVAVKNIFLKQKTCCTLWYFANIKKIS